LGGTVGSDGQGPRKHWRDLSLEPGRTAHCIAALRAIQQMNYSQGIREPSLFALKSRLFTRISAFPAAQAVRLNDACSSKKCLHLGPTSIDDVRRFHRQSFVLGGDRIVLARSKFMKVPSLSPAFSTSSSLGTSCPICFQLSRHRDDFF